MSIARRIAPFAMSVLTSSHTRQLRRAAAELARRSRGRTREVHYFYQASDPYSHVAAQPLRTLSDRYDIALVAHLVAPPSDAAAPERALLEAFARRDAADIASGYRLAFFGGAPAPAAEHVARAERVLACAIARGGFAENAPRVGAALWAGDGAALASLAGELGEAGEAETREALAAGSALRERLGHYLGAMFYFSGEWYWGVDRLDHLERRLIAEGAARAGASARPLARRPSATRIATSSGDPAPGSDGPLSLEYFASLRSPYTYIATERVSALAKRYGIQLVLRPVLPMVMRGLPVPRAKQLYIALDTKREAEDAGVAFGRICDPVGQPVERCFSLYPWARSRTRTRAAAGIHAGGVVGGRRYRHERRASPGRRARGPRLARGAATPRF